MNLAQLLIRSAAAAPGQPALALERDARMDYRTLALTSARLAGGLAGTPKLEPGARAALVLKNGTDYVPLLFACWHAGLAAAPGNADVHAKRVAFIITDFRA